MSIFSESKILIEIIKIIAPFFLKTRQDINVYKELYSVEVEPSKKKNIENKTKDLIVQEATQSNKFDYESILKFNENYQAAKLGMYHFKFLSDQDKKSVLITYDENNHVDMIIGRITPQELKKRNFNALVFLLMGGAFWFTPIFVNLFFHKVITLNKEVLMYYIPFLSFIIGTFFGYIFFIKVRTLLNYQYLLSHGVIKNLPYI
ncbi:TPA: hypothetical protein LUC54_000247 [Acinetobacter baumannii]|jgi:hypothetical protein|uniref:Uncharacterized protein n=2 Tax=Acinetobacter baumannii (strain ATCC 19606 / DSM 30007 / JCM 6841 / CCUG 19606 / CIP 70.34 / NBRC 109757 / NCIMB 12457 / NCTC 12156 / 81) TaxID=575584 RepID=D0C729_ACIB2|nr:hypothetical protein [Acinetobacter baumannii]ARN30746.1 hypothetical protein A4U85_08450 [Acinetobacter baumannii]EEX04794.1 hypothetical protein HMPREF0010_00559 [Acinetobacter baumannii ATCC 19606 = CIP 70.34 = JCM 6841]EKV2267264.1 hypothetical protein [Acinetobacter baumannii]EKV2802048.1 hypothetical protein [Acinetobacter baumannii]EME56535.1 hypothetical protein G347_10566 [Acinetobacter baumannii MSP4-16]